MKNQWIDNVEKMTGRVLQNAFGLTSSRTGSISCNGIQGQSGLGSVLGLLRLLSSGGFSFKLCYLVRQTDGQMDRWTRGYLSFFYFRAALWCDGHCYSLYLLVEYRLCSVPARVWFQRLGGGVCGYSKCPCHFQRVHISGNHNSYYLTQLVSEFPPIYQLHSSKKKRHLCLQKCL